MNSESAVSGSDKPEALLTRALLDSLMNSESAVSGSDKPEALFTRVFKQSFMNNEMYAIWK